LRTPPAINPEKGTDFSSPAVYQEFEQPFHLPQEEELEFRALTCNRRPFWVDRIRVNQERVRLVQTIVAGGHLCFLPGRVTRLIRLPMRKADTGFLERKMFRSETALKQSR
jgi:hypothetical protein